MALPGKAVMLRTVAQLCLLTMFALCLGAAAPGPATVNVTMVDYKLNPTTWTLQPWRALWLHLENQRQGDARVHGAGLSSHRQNRQSGCAHRNTPRW